MDAGLVAGRGHPGDGRAVQLELSPAGTDLAARIKDLEARLAEDIDRRTAGLDTVAAIELLHALVADRPTGLALNRRRQPGPTP